MRRTICALMVMTMTWIGSGVGGASTVQATDNHCVVHVIGQQRSGELIVTDPVCYSSLDAAMEKEGVGAWGPDASQSEAAVATFTIGIHYDGFNFTGSSMSVVGSNCLGGWLNVSAAWNNRISSTEHGCPRIRHYSGFNLTGSTQTTYAPGANLSSLNNLTSSIQYLT